MPMCIGGATRLERTMQPSYSRMARSNVTDHFINAKYLTINNLTKDNEAINMSREWISQSYLKLGG